MSTSTATAPARQRKPRVKPERRCRLSDGLGGARRILTLFIGTEAFLYWLEAIPADWGRAFQLEKFEGGDVYDVHFDQATGDSCTCLGSLRHGHCKHRDALAALIKAGKL
jgi:hypothetical protein